MPHRVFLSGAAGFVGSSILDELLVRDCTVHTLVHHAVPKATSDRVLTFPGSIFDSAALDRAMAGCSAAIHLVGIIFENKRRGVTFQRMHVDATHNVVGAVGRAGVRRLVDMSALGAGPDAASTYHQTKYAAEQIVRASALDWTIFRPSVIHGPRGEFMRMAARWARRTAPPFLFMPYFGAGLLGHGGAGLIQPIFVGDVARAFADALDKPGTIGEVYPLGGPASMTWPEMLRTIALAVVGHKRWVFPIPAWKARLLTRVLPAALLPFNHDQVVMSQQDNSCDMTKFIDDFAWTPIPFDQSVRSYAGQL